MKSRSPRFYFAFRSPYSWIAARLLEERIPSAPEMIEYLPYWEPDDTLFGLLRQRGGDHLYAPMSRQKHLYILQDIKRLAAKLGYPLAWPVDKEPWWERPHLAYLKARHLGKGGEFFWAVYRARWERGEDICAEPTLRQLAVEADLDPDLLTSAPQDPEIRLEGIEALYQAYEEGVFGVPFFKLGYEKFWGVDRLEEFVSRLEGSLAKEAAGAA